MGTAATHPDARGHPAHFPRRRVLLDRHAAAGVARIQPVQPRRLPHQRLSLVLLRCRRRKCGGEFQHDGGIHDRLPAGHFLDIQDGVSAEELSADLGE